MVIIVKRVEESGGLIATVEKDNRISKCFNWLGFRLRGQWPEMAEG